MDGDGDDDIVVTSATRHIMTVLLQDNATHAFNASPIDRWVFGQPSALAIGDIDHDERNDIAVMSASGMITLFVRDGSTLVTTKKSPYFIENVIPLIACGDVTGDLLQDLCILSTAWNGVAVTTHRTFGPEETIVPTPSASLGLGVSHSPTALLLADMDNDTRRDIVAISRAQSDVSIVHMAATGPTETSLMLPAPPDSIAIGDGNTDGRKDIVFTAREAGHVFVMLQDTQSHFIFMVDTGSPYLAGDHPSAVVCADITGDGRDDIIVANDTSDTITVLEQRP